MKIFRERLKEAVVTTCKKHGWSQERLAAELDIDRSRLKNYWERATMIPMEVLADLADVLEVDVNWLIGRDVSPEWPKDDPLRDVQLKLDKILERDGKD